MLVGPRLADQSQALSGECQGAGCSGSLEDCATRQKARIGLAFADHINLRSLWMGLKANVPPFCCSRFLPNYKFYANTRRRRTSTQAGAPYAGWTARVVTGT